MKNMSAWNCLSIWRRTTKEFGYAHYQFFNPLLVEPKDAVPWIQQAHCTDGQNYTFSVTYRYRYHMRT